jgi:branched-subunit amino acid transport protein
MSWELLLAIAALTYASRAAAIALLPPMPRRLQVVFDRVPPALFAGLAASALITPTEGLAQPQVLAAAAGALLVSPMRSLLICLVGGVVGYLVVGLIS